MINFYVVLFYKDSIEAVPTFFHPPPAPRKSQNESNLRSPIFPLLTYTFNAFYAPPLTKEGRRYMRCEVLRLKELEG
jgi:hypothetical protein